MKAIRIPLVLAGALMLGLLAACGGGGSAPAAKAPAKKAAKKAPAKKKAAKKSGNPWADAKVGDWAEYKMSQGPMTMEQKWTVTKVTPEEVTYEIATTMMGNTTTITQTVKLNEPGEATGLPKDIPPGVKPEMGTDTVTVNGKTLECRTVAVDAAGKKVKTWISDEVPLSGMVKNEMDGKVMMELVDFGRGG